jgi:ribosomal protein S12 methylthiotransferase accessory factor YcaO
MKQYCVFEQNVDDDNDITVVSVSHPTLQEAVDEADRLHERDIDRWFRAAPCTEAQQVGDKLLR